MPCWQIFEEPQETPQAPQLLSSFMTSVQLVSQARRSDGQTTDFVVGWVTGVSATVMLRDRLSIRSAGGSGEGVSTTIYDVTTGVTGGVTSGSAGKILNMPDTCRKTSAAMMAIITTMAVPTEIPDPAGLPVDGTSALPQDVQNFVSSPFWLLHCGHIRVMISRKVIFL